MGFLSTIRNLDNPGLSQIAAVISRTMKESPEAFWSEMSAILPLSDWPEKPLVRKILVESGKPVLAPLMKICRDDDPALVSEVIDLLVEIGDNDILGLLDDIRKERDDEAGSKAAGGLAELAPKETLPELLSELESAPWERCRAIHDGVLKRLDSVANFLVGLIDKTMMSQTYWILRIIGELGDKDAVTPLISILEEECSEDLAFFLYQTLGKLKCTQATGVLIGKLKQTDDWFVQKTIIRTLGLLQKKETASVLFEYLKSDEWVVSHTAYQSLIPLGETIVDRVLEQLEEANDSVRYFIPKLLGEIKSPRAISALENEIRNENDPVRLAILVEAAGKIDAESFYEMLLPLTESDNWMVRYRTFQALGPTMAERDPEKLYQASEDNNWHVRTAVKLILSALEREKPNN